MRSRILEIGLRAAWRSGRWGAGGMREERRGTSPLPPSARERLITTGEGLIATGEGLIATGEGLIATGKGSS